jgi:Tfp pilus assembly PilM family ATPase
MAKTPSSAVGIDIGNASAEAVVVQRKGANRFVVTDFCVRDMSGPIGSAEQFSELFREIYSTLNAPPRICGISMPETEGFIRIIEQPPTRPEELRELVRLNGAALLNQEASTFVVDCAEAAPAAPEGQRRKYVIGAINRTAVALIDSACHKQKLNIAAIQLAPIATINAFAAADPQTYNNDSFLLLDVGHTSSTINVGAKGELILVRRLDYGEKHLTDALASAGSASAEAAINALEQGDAGLMNAARFSVLGLAREVSSSIGFFEARREESIGRIHISGPVASSRAILQLIAEELHMPCLAWDPFANCEVALHESKKALFRQQVVALSAAAGIALQVLQGK